MEIVPILEMIADQRYIITGNINNHIAKGQVGCLRLPGAIGSQLQSGDCPHGSQIQET